MWRLRNAMGHRSRRWRKRFACGHRGFGRYCHRCAERRRPRPKQGKQHDLQVLDRPSRDRPTEDQHEEAYWQERWQERQDWLDLFHADAVDLRHLPKPIVRKARRILAELEQGKAVGQLLGKRMPFDRNLVRIPVGYRYRLLCRWEESGLRPLKVMSHEAYNRVARNRFKR